MLFHIVFNLLMAMQNGFTVVVQLLNSFCIGFTCEQKCSVSSTFVFYHHIFFLKLCEHSWHACVVDKSGSAFFAFAGGVAVDI